MSEIVKANAQTCQALASRPSRNTLRTVHNSNIQPRVHGRDVNEFLAAVPAKDCTASNHDFFQSLKAIRDKRRAQNSEPPNGLRSARIIRQLSKRELRLQPRPRGPQSTPSAGTQRTRSLISVLSRPGCTKTTLDCS